MPISIQILSIKHKNGEIISRTKARKTLWKGHDLNYESAGLIYKNISSENWNYVWDNKSAWHSLSKDSKKFHK